MDIEREDDAGVAANGFADAEALHAGRQAVAS
jgi:hypothetical protein